MVMHDQQLPPTAFARFASVSKFDSTSVPPLGSEVVADDIANLGTAISALDAVDGGAGFTRGNRLEISIPQTQWVRSHRADTIAPIE
jgi:hypothetical protein